MSIGDIFYLERHKRRLTLYDVACKIGCSALYVSKIETGRILALKSDILFKLCELYGLDSNKIYRFACEEVEKKQAESQSPQKTGSVTCRRSDRVLLVRGYVTHLINHG